MLIYSGFVYDQNANDHLMLKLGISKGDPLYAPKAALLDRLKIVRFVLLTVLSVDGPSRAKSEIAVRLRGSIMKSIV